MGSSKPLGLLLAPLLLVAGFESTAFAQNDAQVCASAAEQGQAARDEGKYRRAREQLLICSRDACPGPIRKDCSEWLGQIDSLAPTVVLIARDGDKDVTDVKVSMDGLSVTERLDGKPMQVDTGEHTFKFERNGAVKEEKVLVGAGQKGRTITVNFGGNVAPKPPVGGPDPKGPGVSTDSDGPSMIPIYALGGVGVVGLAGFTIFGIAGKSDVSDLQGCKPHCAESDVDKARTKLIIADISLGVGVVSLGVAAYLFFTRPKETSTPGASAKAAQPPKPKWWVDGSALPGGGSATFTSQF